LSERKSAEKAVKNAAENPVVEYLERVGYVARGTLYVVTGLLALGVALGSTGGKATDLTGSLVFLIGNPFGKLVLVVMIVGLVAYSIWGFVRAAFDPLNRGDDASGVIARLGFVSSALSYLAIVYFGVQLLGGAAQQTSNGGQQKAIASILSHPFGGRITVILGLVAIAVGFGQFLEAYKATFQRDLKRAEMSDRVKTVAVSLGRYGMAARGITFLGLGWFLIQAGIHHDPGEAQGFGGVFLFLLREPFGHLLLAVVALGFVALGLYSFACARWVRLMGD